MNGKVKVSVIMPAYNEDERIETCFHRVVESLRKYGQLFEIILEEDGSTDRTPEIIDNLAEEYLFVKALHFPRRMGKGFGVRKSLEKARGELIVSIDSDMEYPPERIPELLRKINGVDIVIGGRTNWRNYKTKVWRRLSSIVYSLLLKVLFGVNGLHDPQSGFKVYKRKVIDNLSPLTSNGFEIDTEILVKAVKKGYRVDHLPITYTYKGNSKVDMLRDPLRMLISILRWKINGKCKIKNKINIKRIRRSFKMRREIEKESLRYDQTQAGYESRNPLVRFFFHRKSEKIIKVTSKRTNLAVLDVGCGDGYLLRRLEGVIKVGLDLSLSRLRRARTREPYALLICGDAEHLPFKPSSFDLVTCFDVLEHLFNPQDCVRSLEASTIEGGTILISIPEDRALSLGRLMTSKYPFSLRDHGHIYSFDPQEVLWFFKESYLLSNSKIPTCLFPILNLLHLRKEKDGCLEGLRSD